MDNATPDAIHVSNLSVVASGRPSRVLLEGIGLAAPAGSFIGVIGASGCGKSTLIKALAGELSPTSGEVLLSGHAVRKIREQYPLAVGYLPQFGAFHRELTVEENLRFAAALRLPGSVSEEIREKWIRHIIDLARLESFLRQSYATLSGGQMRRLALAEELIGDPAFLLLDELTSGLDAFSDREMMLWLRDLAHGQGKTVILVTHATYHLEYCDSILLLDSGRQVQFGPVTDLLAAHKVSSIADLFELYQIKKQPLLRLSFNHHPPSRCKA